MMRREIAYKLAGRVHRAGNALEGVFSHHELRLAVLPEDQMDKALAVLQTLPGLCILRTPLVHVLHLDYALAQCSLRAIENLLLEHGVRLDESVGAKMRRSLTHFREDTQIRNAASPQRLIKQSNQVYVKAYEHHPHGDHDDTPPELREIK